ncbi:hypothetical protein D9Q98_009234 [Chlorella vulgaris]|uniref:Cystinosin n=1 Tax=Chlorella vulgaris TaxID=3077 RepID=A0A9D4TP27_CHLVU|nr:hypothetical protein D9Q98_009234 [Chlorella vulgaris]
MRLNEEAEAPESVAVIEVDHSNASRRRWLREGTFWLGTPLLLGLLLGLALPSGEQCPSLPHPLNRLSSIIGWVYFCFWSISFYPQAYLNYRRKSVVGLSLDFQLLNLLGFGCYAVYNAALFWDPLVRREYACLNGGSMPAVHANDVFFALHAFIVTFLTLIQCAVYDRGGQRISWPAALGAGGAAAAILAYLGAVVGAAAQGGHGIATVGVAAAPSEPDLPCGDILSWLSFLYFLSYIKLAVSLVKYIPQVWLNYKRQSTDGWNVYNVMLDFGGGALSLVQLVLDGAATHDWSAVTGNPVKFGLGFTSIFFDLIFMTQHWLLYPGSGTARPSWAAPSIDPGWEQLRGGKASDKQLLGDSEQEGAAAVVETSQQQPQQPRQDAGIDLEGQQGMLRPETD